MMPTRIGPYLISGEIGRGGMGIVYLARDTELDREVAIKALPAERARDPDWLNQLVREAQALGRLNHPNVAQIHSMEVVEGTRYLVIEYVPGESLRDRLLRGRRPLEEWLGICVQIAAGLEAAHNRGVVHRDVKPENVRITPEGLTKVIDFGLALARPLTRELSTAGRGGKSPAGRSQRTTAPLEQTERLWIAGTPGYMSPEQVRGRLTDKRSDIFSFGCVCYECLAGHPAFSGASAAEGIRAVLFEEPDWSRLPRELPGPITDLVLRCLEKNLGRRLCDLGDARIVIERALEDRGEGSPAVRTPPGDEVPNNIPAELSSFVGREAITERLITVLASNRLLTLTGAGGCGKTRLGERLARKALHMCPDGVWVAELAGVNDALMASEIIARAVRLGGQPAAPDRLAEAIGSKEILLVLDNCEHLIDRCRQIVDHLLRSCRALRVLVTSQELLGLPGEFVFPVPSLSLPGLDEEPDPAELTQYESVRLFLDRARLARPGFDLTPANAALVTRICRRLDGIPLAIELAAARLRTLSIEQIHDRLDDGFRLLTGGSPLAVERHRTLRAALDWSYGLLSDVEKRLFRKLSVFTGGWTLGSAAAVCGDGLDEFQVLDMLTRLVEKSLIHIEEWTSGSTPGEPRYRMLETMRHYGMEQMPRPEKAATRDKHLDFFLQLAERSHAEAQTAADYSVAARLMSLENENLLEALRWAMEGDAGAGRDRRLARSLRIFASRRHR